jgi:hypothetical protein
MFAIDCPRHRTTMLVSERRIRALRNTPTGIELDVECYCGHVQSIKTGRRHATTAAA